MWRWWRRLFLLFLWVTVPLGVVLVVWAWRTAPDTFWGISWSWFAGLFLFAWSMSVLNFTIELPDNPLPPEVSAQEEVRRWGFVLIAGLGTGLIFVLFLTPPIIVTHLASSPWVVSHLLRPVALSVNADLAAGLHYLFLVVVWLGWLIGVPYLLGRLLSDNQLVARFRRGRKRKSG